MSENRHIARCRFCPAVLRHTHETRNGICQDCSRHVQQPRCSPAEPTAAEKRLIEMLKNEDAYMKNLDGYYD